MAIDYRIFDRDKFEVVGSPTITDDGILKNPTWGNYLTLPYSLLSNLENGSWSIKFKGKMPNAYTTWFNAIGQATSSEIQVGNINGSGDFYFRINGSDSYLRQVYVEGAVRDNLNKKYECILSFDGVNLYEISLEIENGITYHKSLIFNGNINFNNNFQRIGSGTPNIGIEYDLKYFSIVSNSQEVFSGSHLGTLTDKLVYLNDTKQKIKDAINKFDTGLVTDTTPFRQYSDILSSTEDTIKDGINTINVSTTGASISDKIDAANNSRESIKNAINNKGGSVTDSTPLADYAQAIEDIPSGGGGKKLKIGGFGGTYQASTLITTLDNGENALIYDSMYSGGDGYPASFTGIKPKKIRESDGRIVNAVDNSRKINNFRYRQVFIVNKQNTNTTYSAKSTMIAFMVTQRTTDGSISGYWTHLFLALDVNKSGSATFGTLYPCYYYNGWHDVGGTPVNLGDRIDVTYEYVDNGYTLQVTLGVNNNTPTVYKVTNDDWSLCYNSGDNSLGQVSFAGNRTDQNSSPSGIRCTLLKGTSIFDKTNNEYVWQLFEEVEE